MFKAYQVIVTFVAVIWMLAALDAGTPFFVAIPAALLAMSVLASDPEVHK